MLSVVVTCYRRRAYLEAAVLSAGHQTLPRSEYEILVLKDWIDPEVDRRLEAQCVRVFNGDLAVVGEMIERGVLESRGEAICFLDDDDMFDPTKLEIVAQEFARDPGLVLFRNGFTSIDSTGRRDPRFERSISQPREPFEVEAATVSPHEFAQIVRTRAYGNSSTLSVRRKELLERRADLREIHGAPDGAVGALMLDTIGRHRFDPRPLTLRRIGTSMRMGGPGGEAYRAVETFEYLSTRTHQESARRYSEFSLAWARLDCAIRDPVGRISAGDVLRYVRFNLPRRDAHTWELAMWGAAKWFAPQLGYRAFRRRLSQWNSIAAPPPSGPGGA